ncbi:Ja24 [Japanese cytomegalovirus]|nr:Ja24 [Japanese cytomegalovirus]
MNGKGSFIWIMWHIPQLYICYVTKTKYDIDVNCTNTSLDTPTAEAITVSKMYVEIPNVHTARTDSNPVGSHVKGQNDDDYANTITVIILLILFIVIILLFFRIPQRCWEGYQKTRVNSPY